MSGVWGQSAHRGLADRSPTYDVSAADRTVSVPVIAGLCRAADAALMGVASISAELLLHRFSGSPRLGEATVVSLFAIIATCSLFKWQRLYRLDVLGDPSAAVGRFAVGIVFGSGVSVGILALLQGWPLDWDYLGGYASAWCLVSGAAILAGRSAVAWRLQAHARRDRLALKFAVVGANTVGEAVMLQTAADPGLRCLGVYDDGARAAASGSLRGSVADLVTYARHHPLDAVVIAAPVGVVHQVARLQAQLDGLSADVFLVTDRIRLAAPGRRTEFGGIPVVALAAKPLPDWRGVQKAVFDRVLSGLLLCLGLPLMAIIAVCIKATSPGPVLFRQTRDGLHGVPFTMLKFRSMLHDEAADQSIQAVRHDPRVTRVGSWLRRTSLDELPQLYNVLRGDMSLVGPRPHLATTCAGTRLFRDIVPTYAARHRVKPGLTGWAQVHGLRGETRTEQQIADRVAHDLYYIENWSLGLDLRIIWLTLIQEVRSRSGNAY